MNSATFYERKKAAVMDDDDDQSSESEFFSDKSDESLQDSSSSDDSYEEEEADDLLDDENFDDSTNSVAPAMQPNWKLVATSTRSFPFTGKEEMCLQPTIDPENGKPKPIDLFNLFISDDVVNHIVCETNRYASRCIANATITRTSVLKYWKDTTPAELRKFIGLLIYMGLVPKPQISLYWSKRALYEERFAPQVMSRDRFQILLRSVYFNNNAGALSQQDKLHKVRPLVDMMCSKYQEAYKPGPDLVIDESMIAFRGRVGIRQYLPGKSHKYGLKLYKICTPAAYTWNFKIHCGRHNEMEGLSGTESLTVGMAQKILNTGSTIFADNYHTSVGLAEYLLGKKTYV
ncbi:PiggyBac transposable element-derived protein [Trinorchestia longiramus]|nr:PiggyBac transposable element-derived protein [Trinorchestia longiramus]